MLLNNSDCYYGSVCFSFFWQTICRFSWFSIFTRGTYLEFVCLTDV